MKRAYGPVVPACRLRGDVLEGKTAGMEIFMAKKIVAVLMLALSAAMLCGVVTVVGTRLFDRNDESVQMDADAEAQSAMGAGQTGALSSGPAGDARQDGEPDELVASDTETETNDSQTAPVQDPAADTAAPEENAEQTDDAQISDSSSGDSAVSQTDASTESGPVNREPNGKTIVIDPGHQAKANSDKEPLGPGSDEMKAKVSSGTSGAVSGLEEYELDLTVSLKLRDELENRGYTVKMTRTSNDVDISNVERAEMANEANADVFIRVHANGSEDSSVNGVMVVCQSSDNPWCSDLYEQSCKLSHCVLDGVVAATGAGNEGVWVTDTMVGINWSRVPVTILEMGYLTNPDEDRLLATEDYQDKIVQGAANGIDRFLGIS